MVNDLKFHRLRRYQLQNINIPQVTQVKSIDYVKNLVNARNGCENNFLIPLSNCNCVITRLESQKFVGTVVNKHFFF